MNAVLARRLVMTVGAGYAVAVVSWALLFVAIADLPYWPELVVRALSGWPAAEVGWRVWRWSKV